MPWGPRCDVVSWRAARGNLQLQRIPRWMMVHCKCHWLSPAKQNQTLEKTTAEFGSLRSLTRTHLCLVPHFCTSFLGLPDGNNIPRLSSWTSRGVLSPISGVWRWNTMDGWSPQWEQCRPWAMQLPTSGKQSKVFEHQVFLVPAVEIEWHWSYWSFFYPRPPVWPIPFDHHFVNPWVQLILGCSDFVDFHDDLQKLLTTY